MSSRIKQDIGISEARLRFARRLRALRVPRGFRTARSLARTLEIDENRYTRYERAEVEPDLDMIRRICDALGVSPSDLLGPADPVDGPDGTAPGPHTLSQAVASEPVNIGNSLGIETAAWLLAEAAVALQHTKARLDPFQDLPLSAVARTGSLYRALMHRPFQAITDLLADPDLAGATDAEAALLKERIDAMVSLLKELPQP